MIDLDPYMARLRDHYAERTPIYWQLSRLTRIDGPRRSIAQLGGEREDGTLTLGQLQRLMRAIVMENQL